MDARYINEDEIQTICRLIRSGSYPFAVPCEVNGQKGTAFIYRVDAEGTYFGTTEPTDDAIRWAMAYLAEHEK